MTDFRVIINSEWFDNIAEYVAIAFSDNVKRIKAGEHLVLIEEYNTQRIISFSFGRISNPRILVDLENKQIHIKKTSKALLHLVRKMLDSLMAMFMIDYVEYIQILSESLECEMFLQSDVVNV